MVIKIKKKLAVIHLKNQQDEKKSGIKISNTTFNKGNLMIL